MGFIGIIRQALVSLVYPDFCEVCGESLVSGERVICISCLYEMPRTRFWTTSENEMERMFWGRIKIEHACALFYFRKGSAFRPLLHKLKYKGIVDIGRRLGEELGNMLSSSELYSDVDCIVPVPLHSRKERNRGYNQSDYIAEGLSARMNDIPVMKNNLIRTTFTETQTRRGRIDRWKNVSTVFAVQNPEAFRGKHILLVDDVITTGATLEACAETLLKSTDCKISIAALAFVSR
ncbi:MAG: ComF family protein [Prevotellaceae bacterium]|jgi:ComF family protein|nr:ComF family protein [Prevotellaceae bacterium]